jgi:hypothetical protein
MTGYTVHTGATEKFVAGWDEIFKKQAKAKGPATKKKSAAAKKKPAATTVAKSKGRKAGKKKK